MPSRPAYNQTVQHRSDGLPASTKVVTKKVRMDSNVCWTKVLVSIRGLLLVRSYKFYQPINQLVTSGNAGLYSQNKIEEGLHSALGIQHENDDAA